ncbi:hypothetical protein CEXT_630351 [Caerostris extrusa]|uniref:HNH homing endonuclease n=1 Tax=Caerostris extrusa TaxID=172846 RepID=A0AAV4XN98_CAEEX|nr:hypothetical protein CEXT_630351 [Caerostris extrusa]
MEKATVTECEFSGWPSSEKQHGVQSRNEKHKRIPAGRGVIIPRQRVIFRVEKGFNHQSAEFCDWLPSSRERNNMACKARNEKIHRIPAGRLQRCLLHFKDQNTAEMRQKKK